jgi:hypothetical protein
MQHCSHAGASLHMNPIAFHDDRIQMGGQIKHHCSIGGAEPTVTSTAHAQCSPRRPGLLNDRCDVMSITGLHDAGRLAGGCVSVEQGRKGLLIGLLTRR